ncbi:PAS/PAC sensor signal transduction histidine kinase [Methanoculleus marisnigri JR1]|uniref:histidine kinase n=1 Tax=Methanoculleus marisnigri (strain ATCC 35101 / DSM 1498 / JR1) TaxID=368407 RepID=A3CTZ5_METMJ|nr:PAS/PAC sensor signal transduction histidine kinase [Methanoculleus marisnigri JR1]
MPNVNCKRIPKLSYGQNPIPFKRSTQNIAGAACHKGRHRERQRGKAAPGRRCKLPAAPVRSTTRLPKEEQILTRDYEALEKMAETTQYLENLITYANAPIIVWDASLRITRFNNAFERLTGRAADEVIGRSPEILFPETRREELMDLIRKTTAGERWETVEIPILTADGRIRTVLWNSAAVYGDDRKTVSSVIAQGQDITERKRAEEALKRAHDEQEMRVRERTLEIRAANEALQAEITERTRAEEAVKAERKRLYDVLEMLPVYVVLLSPDYHVPFANRFFREQFGESDGRRCFDYLFSRSEPCENCESYRVMKTGAPHHWEWTGPDGRDYDIFDFPFTEADGSPHILEVGIDITKRKRAEEALQRLNETLEERVIERTDELAKANAILNAICENTPAPIYVTDRQSRLVMCNPAVLRTLGRSHPEVLGKSKAELLGPEVGGPVVANEQRVMETGITETFEEEIGHRIYYSTKTPLRNLQGDVTGAIAVGTEITELKRVEAQRQKLLEQLQQSAEEMEVQNEELQCTTEQLQEKTEELALLNRALQESEEHFRSLIENASDIILLLDMQGRITYASPSVRQIGGYEPDNLIGTDVLDLIHPEDAPKAIEAVRTGVARPSTSLTFEVRVRDATGRWIILDVTGASLIREGSDRRFIVNARDVTDRKHAEEERNRLITGLEAAHREANLYLDIITHDIRNANNVSSIYADLMLELLEGAERTYARKLRDSISRSTEILMNVSTIRRIHACSTGFSPVDLNAVVSEEAGNFRGASIRREIPPLEVQADNLLSTVFMNLIGNSVKFGGPGVEIVVRAEERDGEVLVTVEDNGPGVPDDVKKKLFHRFERGKARGRGDGLGLFICRTVTERYGGRIWIEDRVPGRPEEGAAFRFTLKPAKRDRDPGS